MRVESNLGPFTIPLNQELTAQEKKVEALFVAAIQKNPEGVINSYLNRFGWVIDSARVAELCEEYAVSAETRAKWSRAVLNPARALADELYRRAIRRESPSGEGLRILFLSGGPAAGKSTALEALFTNTAPDDRHDVFVETSLSNEKTASAKIQEALDWGHSVTILHVYRAFSETVEATVERALDIGRVLTLERLAANHFDAREVLFAIQNSLGDRISIRAIENSSGNKPREITLSELTNKHRQYSVEQCLKQRVLFWRLNFPASKQIIRKFTTLYTYTMRLSSDTGCVYLLSENKMRSRNPIPGVASHMRFGYFQKSGEAYRICFGRAVGPSKFSRTAESPVHPTQQDDSFR